MSESKLVPLTGLWKNETKDGEEYFTGRLGSSKMVILKNSYKKEDKHPDYVAYVAPYEKKEETTQEDASEGF